MRYLHYLDKCESLTCTPSFHSFSFLSLSLSRSVFERQQQQARQSSRPRRGLLAFSCHSGENTAESRRARERACACVHVQAFGYLGEKEKKQKALRFYTLVPSHKRRRKKEKNKKKKHTKKKSERGSELSVLSKRKKNHSDYWSSLTCRKEAKVAMRRQKESVRLFRVTQRRPGLQKLTTANIKAAAGRILPFRRKTAGRSPARRT